jgi:hypothetical protein
MLSEKEHKVFITTLILMGWSSGINSGLIMYPNQAWKRQDARIVSHRHFCVYLNAYEYEYFFRCDTAAPESITNTRAFELTASFIKEQ